MKEIFPAVYKKGNRLFTRNLTPGLRVYGEKLVNEKGIEYREWIPTRSKLAAAIVKGLTELPVQEQCKVLYLGASTGTTVSHVSDIVGKKGFVYAVEFSERVFRSLIDLAKKRKNIAPVLADARRPREYPWCEEVGVVYCDVADPQETELAMRNAYMFLKENGCLMIAVKSQSIDVTKKSKDVYEEEKKKLENSGFRVTELIDLEPLEKNHAMIIAKK